MYGKWTMFVLIIVMINLITGAVSTSLANKSRYTMSIIYPRKYYLIDEIKKNHNINWWEFGFHCILLKCILV